MKGKDVESSSHAVFLFQIVPRTSMYKNLGIWIMLEQFRSGQFHGGRVIHTTHDEIAASAAHCFPCCKEKDIEVQSDNSQQ